MKRSRELNRVLRIRVSEEMLAELVTRASRQQRSAGAVARAALTGYLNRGKK